MPSRDDPHAVDHFLAVLAALPVSAAPAPLKVVATTGMIADAARVVGGDSLLQPAQIKATSAGASQA